MNVGLEGYILAVVVKIAQANKVAGGAPVFIVQNDKELEEMSSLISRITSGMAHQLDEGIRIIVKH